jgi:hypothetical protein
MQQPPDSTEVHQVDLDPSELHPDLLPVLTENLFVFEPKWSDLMFRRNPEGYGQSLYTLGRFVLLPAPTHLWDGMKATALTAACGFSAAVVGVMAIAAAPFAFVGRAIKMLAFTIAGVFGYLDIAPSKENISELLNEKLAEHPSFEQLKAAGHKVTLEPGDIPDELIQRLDATTRRSSED